MTFVDPLAVMLIGLAMGTLLGAFYFFFAARGDKEQIKSLVVPAFGVGAFDLVSGFYFPPYFFNLNFFNCTLDSPS